MIYILVAFIAGIGIGTVTGAYFHEYIVSEEEYYVIEKD